MRIPYEKRVDRYDVKWKKVEPKDGEAFKYATITIRELWSIGHLVFKEPLVIEVFLGDVEDTSALACYDFGMDDRIATDKDKNWLHNYAGDNKDCKPIKTVFASIKFDLMHTFFHYKGDPNYNHTHWALYGNLKDRVTADDSYIFDDIEYEDRKRNLELAKENFETAIQEHKEKVEYEEAKKKVSLQGRRQSKARDTRGKGPLGRIPKR